MDDKQRGGLARVMWGQAAQKVHENYGHDDDYQESNTAVARVLQEVAEVLEGWPLEVTLKHPSVDELMDEVRPILGDLQHTLLMRGLQYGEEVLAVMGEAGIAEFVHVKAWRTLGSIRKGDPQTTRYDSWLDIAGYAVLVLAMQRWEQKNSAGGTVETPTINELLDLADTKIVTRHGGSSMPSSTEG